ncbi:MAG: nucleotidyltransferase domain-containing protein [Hydrogenimonas sp.]|nr:MAG: nucleotidyltransferase domain-containing protein [Hydrogenimonas sp.]
MRLTEFEAVAIKEVFLEVFKEGDLYLFGSRVDDKKLGGDIDLFIDLPYEITTEELVERRRAFRIKLQDRIGEQKIDIVISKDTSKGIEKEALKRGILL